MLGKEPFLEGETCRVVKTGQDAVRAAVIDLDVSGDAVVTSDDECDAEGLYRSETATGGCTVSFGDEY